MMCPIFSLYFMLFLCPIVIFSQTEVQSNKIYSNEYHKWLGTRDFILTSLESPLHSPKNILPFANDAGEKKYSIE